METLPALPGLPVGRGKKLLSKDMRFRLERHVDSLRSSVRMVLAVRIGLRERASCLGSARGLFVFQGYMAFPSSSEDSLRLLLAVLWLHPRMRGLLLPPDI